MLKVRLAALAVCLCAAQAATAHEFWIEPRDYIVSEDMTIQADLKVGENYSGADFAFLPNRFRDLSATGPLGKVPIEGVIGDLPAISAVPQGDGLHLLAYHSTADRLTFDEMDEFAEYVAYEGNDWAIAEHRRLGLPEVEFVEAYTRCAKALVQVGSATGGEDRAVGMPLEIVALRSPYGPGVTQNIPFILLRDGKAMPGQRINVFFKGESSGPSHYVTDADGRTEIDVSRPGRYLLNAVWMRPAAPGGEVAWESFWASLTFEIKKGAD